MMDINNLEAFIEVAERKSFSKTAESLHLTQPAVSKRIAALESELTLRLFDRVGRSVHLTEAGKVLLPAALKIRSEVSRVSTDLISLGKEVGGKLSIGATTHVGLDCLAQQLKSYKRRYPDVDIDLQFLSADEAFAAIDSGKVELILWSANTPSPAIKSQSRLAYFELQNEKLQVVVENDHPLARKLGAISTAELAAYPAILPLPGSLIRQSIDQMMEANGVQSSVAMEAKNMATTRSMVASGLGWALLPPSMPDDRLVVLDVPDLWMNYSVDFARNVDRSLSRAAQAFVELLPAKVLES